MHAPIPFVLAAALLASAAPALAGPPEDFKALTDEYWAFVLREIPTFASTLGIRDYDDRAGRHQPCRRGPPGGAKRGASSARLNAIPDAGLSPGRPDQQGDPEARASRNGSKAIASASG